MSKMKDLAIDELNRRHTLQRPLSDDTEDYIARLEEYSDELELKNDNLYEIISIMEERLNRQKEQISRFDDLKLFNALKMSLMGFEIFGSAVSTIKLQNGDLLKLEILKQEEKENGET